jgi:F0F1-type ATP synthase delta subunit
MLERKIKKKIAFDLVEDPCILGGFIFSTGTELIDASMSGMLASMRRRLSAAQVS